MLFLRLEARTTTRPRWTLVSVPSQRSAIVHFVPRTVAELVRPLVRKRPRALARRRLIVARLSEALARFPPPARQREKLEPFNTRSVSPFALRLRDWRTWNSPLRNLPV